MIIPFSRQPQGTAAPAGPQVSPTYLAMAAAMMHQEGRWPSDSEFQTKAAKPDGQSNSRAG